jgi:hypothetical protein
MEITPAEAMTLSLIAELVAAKDIIKAKTFLKILRGKVYKIAQLTISLKIYSQDKEDSEDDNIRIANKLLKWAEYRLNRK